MDDEHRHIDNCFTTRGGSWLGAVGYDICVLIAPETRHPEARPVI